MSARHIKFDTFYDLDKNFRNLHGRLSVNDTNNAKVLIDKMHDQLNLLMQDIQLSTISKERTCTH